MWGVGGGGLVGGTGVGDGGLGGGGWQCFWGGLLVEAILNSFQKGLNRLLEINFIEFFFISLLKARRFVWNW